MIDSFIRVWDRELPDHICDEIINVFEETLKRHPNEFKDERTRQPFCTNLGRDDLAINLANSKINRLDLVNAVDFHIKRCLMEYKFVYGQIAFENYTTSNQYKIQRTMPFGGYHSWHYECASRADMCLREVVWTIYLNDMPPHEAETEFLYQRAKVSPRKGSVCLFPAAMTHVHRGLTVYSHPKYIATGWFSKILEPNDNHKNQQQLEFDFT